MEKTLFLEMIKIKKITPTWYLVIIFTPFILSGSLSWLGKEGELFKEATVRNFRAVQKVGERH
ncbi:MAG: hypothetical protein WD098_05435 [Balneolales bacterium]